MNAPLQDVAYKPAHAIEEIADFVADKVEPADFPQTILRFRNDRAAAEIGLAGLSDVDWLRHFGRFEPLPDAQPHPLALRYHGHQFRNYNPDIGDGRGFLFAQMYDVQGRLIDLGTKGSGQTPYSRFGDGRLTLKGAVREILATEMLEAQGVPTSRTLSVIETGEALRRGDEPSPTRSAVLVRQSHGHIRIGTFQRLAYLRDAENLERLVEYSLRHYFGASDASNPAVTLLHKVVERTAELAAAYIVAGFVHGVLNSDNINITGESFDYGPWRWTPTFDPGFTAAYFDETGLYAFGRQAEAIHWDVAQLAISLTTIAEENALVPALERFGPIYREALVQRMLQRLHHQSQGPEADLELVQAAEQALHESQVPLEKFYFDWARDETSLSEYAGPAFNALKGLWQNAEALPLPNHPYWQSNSPQTMLIEEVEAIWAAIAEQDDWQPLYQKVTEIREMGQANLRRQLVTNPV